MSSLDETLLYQNNDLIKEMPQWWNAFSLNENTKGLNSIMRQQEKTKIPSFLDSLNNQNKTQTNSTWYNFFGDTPASTMQGMGSMLKGIGGVYDAVQRNKFQKKAMKLEQEAIDRELDHQRNMKNMLHSVWGEDK